jgi:hypothetical protein
MTLDWRDELRQLAAIESPHGCAISFYFQPETPQDRSHRQEAIKVKDLVRDALKNLDRTGDHARARADLERILALADQLHNNHSRAKAIFACAEHGIWKEFDLPPAVGRTHLHVNNRFHLTPIASASLDLPRATVLLIDRENARILDLELDQVTERATIHNELPRRGRSDGFRGYDGGHLERHVDNEAMRHFKEVWSEVEPHLHTYVRDALLSRIDVDPGASLERIREESVRVLEERRRNDVQGAVREVLGEAQRNGRGSVGLHHVLTSLERGEVQKLFLGRQFNASIVECAHCGHLDTRHVKQCAICGKETREIDDAVRALLGHALQGGVEIAYVPDDDEEFQKAGNIAALLRFRADQNTPAKTKTVASETTIPPGERAVS